MTRNDQPKWASRMQTGLTSFLSLLPLFLCLSPSLSLPSLTLVNYWTHWLGLPYKADSWLAKHYGGRIGEKTRWAVWIAKSSECKSKLHPSFLTRSCANTSKGANFLLSLLLSAGHEEHFHSLFVRSLSNQHAVCVDTWLPHWYAQHDRHSVLFCTKFWMNASGCRVCPAHMLRESKILFQLSIE